MADVISPLSEHACYKCYVEIAIIKCYDDWIVQPYIADIISPLSEHLEFEAFSVPIIFCH